VKIGENCRKLVKIGENRRKLVKIAKGSGHKIDPG
jgi:hypothetical protein